MSKTSIEIIKPTDLTVNEAIIKEGADKLIARSQETSIDSQDAMEEGATIAKSLKALAKKVEDIRKHKVDPLNEQVKAINLRLKTNISDRLSEAAKSMEKKMLEYTREQERIAEEERIAREKQIEEERFAAMILAEDAGEDDQVIIVQESAPVTAVAVPQITRSASGAIASVRRTWTFEVVDIVEFAKNWPDAVEVKSSEVNQAIRDGHRDIPGLRIFQQESLGVR